MFLSPCCPNLKCKWGQAGRTEVCLTDRTDGCDHTAGKYRRRSKSGDYSVLMDINQLEEQYDSMRQRQKKQTHVVFTAGVNKRARGEFFNLPIKTVSVNCTAEKPLALEEDLPVNSITLDFPSKDYIQDHEAPWRTHLDIHRVVLAQNTGQKSQVQEDKKSDDQNPQFASVNKSIPSNEGATSHNDNKNNGEATTVSANELRKTIHSFKNYNHCIPQINKRFSFPNERSNIWASKNGYVTRIAPITKVDYYPFPHMKTPRKSATAKSLGLYNKY